VDSGNSAQVNVITNLTLDTNISVPAGVALIVKSGKTLTVDTGKTLDLTGGGLVLDNGATLTVDGTVNAKASIGETSFGIGIMPGAGATINGSGVIHLKTRGTLLPIDAGQKLTLAGSVTLDGLRTGADGGTDTDDAINNAGHVVFVSGELDMQGGTITGNYNTANYDGGGVEVNGERGGVATFTMSGGVIMGNKTRNGGAGVNVVHGATFVMEGSAKISNNTADEGGGGVRINQGSSYSATTFTMKGNAEISGNTAADKGGGVWVRDGGAFILEGGAINGSGEATNPNTASSGASLYVASGTAEWGANVTTQKIGGASSGSPGDNIISSGNAVDGTIYAESP
jgi:hypothetical protein